MLGCESLPGSAEGGAAGAIHGAIQAGSLGTTFTASQGLLLKIPNMYKIAGELTPFVLHVSARTLATHALQYLRRPFGCDGLSHDRFRATGVCKAFRKRADMAAIAHASTLRTRVPFLHFFDGFRTSHEVTRIQQAQ